MSVATLSQTVPVGLAGPQQRAFNPYSSNGGTILAISSKDFAVVASDTRQSEGFSIQSRYQPRCHQLTDAVVIAVQGFMADANTLVKRVKQKLEWYYHTHATYPDLKAIARLVQTLLYGKRFFPYYTYVILGGIDRDGTGAVYSFDPVGSYARVSCRAAGAAESLVQPFLDHQVDGKDLTDPTEAPVDLSTKALHSNLPLPKVLGIVTDAFTGAAERHIAVGDGLEIYVIRVEGEGSSRKVEIEVHFRDLKQD